MEIHGLQKMTLLDYPGKVACTVFLSGCDFRCPFCHNGELVTGTCPPETDDQGLLAFLNRRKGLLDGVCVTGGEPLLRPDLPLLLGEIKELGFRVNVDTNGTHPDRAAPAGGGGAGGLCGHGREEQPGAVRGNSGGVRPGAGICPGQRVLSAVWGGGL